LSAICLVSSADVIPGLRVGIKRKSSHWRASELLLFCFGIKILLLITIKTLYKNKATKYVATFEKFYKDLFSRTEFLT
jgi:hypothetical protein